MVNHIFRPNGTKETIDSMITCPTKQIRNRNLSNEWNRLAQGNTRGVSSTDTLDFIYQHAESQGRDVIYATYVLNHRPLKSGPYILRITVVGNRLTYNEESGSPADSLFETKSLISSTISNTIQRAKFMTADIRE